MNALEQEIINKFNQLDEDAQQRVRAHISKTPQSGSSTFDYETWASDVEAIRRRMGANAETQAVDVVGILRGIRDGEDE